MFQKMSNFLPSFTPHSTRDNSQKKDASQISAQLQFAASSGDKSTLKKLLEDASGDAIDAKDHLGQTALMYSVVHNEVECASALLKAGARVDNSDNTGQTALHIAINKGFHRCVKLLLSNGALWHQTDLEGVTTLHAAAIHPSPKCLTLILRELKPGEVDIQDSNKKTALHWSAAYANVEHIKLLLKQGANVCIPDFEGKTPLHWAATSSDVRALVCLKVLLEEEPSVINWQDYEGHSALHLSVSSGTTQMVDFLTSQGNCNINILDNSFSTPLHWAARQGLADKVALLLDRGAVYSCADGYGATAMHYAAHHNRADTIKVFLSRSYITDEPDSEGRNSLIWAAARKADDVILMMARFKANLSYKAKDGSTALHAAAIQGHASTTELLLTLNADIDNKDDGGMTPFLRACELGRFKVIQVLLKNGASLSATDRNKCTGLHWAARGGHAYLCQMLIQQGCGCDVQDNFGMTPLHYASAAGCTGCVSVLLESKANPDIADKEGKTPLHLAALKNHFDAVKLLIEHGAYINSMAMLNQWVTPLDCAIQSENIGIFQFLQSIGSLTAFEIESLAAQKIQDWYRNVVMKRKIVSVKQFKVEEHPHCLSSKMDDEHVLEVSKQKSSTRSLGMKISSSEVGSPLNSGLVKENCQLLSVEYHSKIPVAMWYYSRKNNRSISCNCGKATQKYVHSKREQELAALTIQKAWKKFLLKKKIVYMRRKIDEAFHTVECRKVAEHEWQQCVKIFLSQL